MTRANGSTERGYNLVEVLIAMALLGTVLLSIVTLFFFGRTNVYAGKTMSQGVAIGTHSMEDLSSATINDVQSIFGIADNEALEDFTVDAAIGLPASAYTDSVLRTSEDISADTDPNGYLQDWLDAIQAGNKLGQARVHVIVTPSHPNPMAAPLTMGNATIARVRVLVRWQEGLRWRQVVLDTVKTRRPTF